MKYCANCGSMVPESGVCSNCQTASPGPATGPGPVPPPMHHGPPPPPPMRGPGMQSPGMPPGYGPQPYPGYPPRGGSSPVLDFITFKLMVTPLILTILYCATAVLSALGIVVMMSTTMGAVGFFVGLFVAAIVQVPIRMYFEILILLFKIKDDLGDISKHTKP